MKQTREFDTKVFLAAAGVAEPDEFMERLEADVFQGAVAKLPSHSNFQLRVFYQSICEQNHPAESTIVIAVQSSKQGLTRPPPLCLIYDFRSKQGMLSLREDGCFGPVPGLLIAIFHFLQYLAEDTQVAIMLAGLQPFFTD